MDPIPNGTMDRNIFNRSMHSMSDENANAVKNPALLNPLQEIGNSSSYRMRTMLEPYV